MATEYKLSYTGSEINQKLAKIDSLAQKSEVPTKTSDLTNDSGFITGYTETDPTVPSWAKQPTKPTYTANEVGLGNVENKSSATIRGELTKANVTDALGYTPPTQDTVYTHPTTSGNKHIPSGGSSGQILKWSSDGTAVWGDVEWSGGSTESDGGLPPLRIYAVKNGVSYTQEIVEGGATQTYTAAEIHEIAKQRVVTIETYTSRDASKGQGVHQYYRTEFAANGTVNQVVFRGVYLNDTYKTVPSYVTINQLKNVFVSDEEWSGGSVETDATLTQNGFPANAKTVGDRLTALSEQIANSSGGTSIDVTAKVGQTIVVKEVDANGKPTAWEAADHQPRTHWSEFGTVEIMPETTFEIDPETGGEFLVNCALEPNKAYTIIYNGVEYADCVGMELVPGELYFGNLSVVDESLPVTEHPFALMSAAADIDGDGNVDYYMALLPLDGSTSVTLSISGEGEIAHKIPKKYVPTLEEMRTEVVEILPETTIPIDPDGGENMISVDFALEPNKPYTIKYNGVEYADCVGVVMNEVAVGFGNLGATDESLPTTNHPFVLGSMAMDMDEDGNIDYTIAVMPLDGSETVTLSILDEKVQKIPVKYLPDSIPYSETNLTEILSETTVEIDLDSGEGYYTEAIGLSVGKNYTVRWNGIEYNCTAQDFYTPVDEEGNTAHVGVVVGNLGITMGGEGTGEPFIIADVSSEFAAESGAPVMICALDGSESVTLSIAEQTEIIRKLDGKYLPDGMPYSEMGLAELMPETTLVTNDNETYYYTEPIGLVAGRNYTVKLNGMPLSCTAQDAIENGMSRGVMLAVDEQPFLIEFAPEYVELTGGYHGAILAPNGSKSITVSVLGESEIIHKIDNKYLPDSVGYEEIVPVLSTFSLTGLTSSNYFRLDIPLKFAEGNTYIVNWNGVKYTCVASLQEFDGDAEDTVYIGNLDKHFGNGDTGEPFVIRHYADLLIYPLDGTTEGTISIDQVVTHKIPLKYLPDTIPYEEITVVVPTTEFTERPNEFMATSSQPLVPDSTYVIEWDGVSYTCTSMGIDTEDGVAVCIGNLSVIGGEDTGEPFTILGQGNTVIFAPVDRSVTSVTVSLTHHYIHKIDEKYLPSNTNTKLNTSNPVATGSFSLGRKANTDIGANSVATGRITTASGDYSHAEGEDTTASGQRSHAEGCNTTASGGDSHAEGGSTTASGIYSHAEGEGTTASGRTSHTEGYNTTASDWASHAEGNWTIASGMYSHAEGCWTIASGSSSHVQGEYNIEDTAGKYAHIVGNGTSNTARSNAHTLDWDGNAWFAGGIELTSPGGTRYRFTVSDDGTLTSTVVE